MNREEKFWSGKFGNEYTDRNNMNLDKFYKEKWGITRSEINRKYIGEFDTLLEVGCNRGLQLEMLEGKGDLYGVDINSFAIEKATVPATIIRSSATNLPFDDNFFDVVMTNGLLIHIGNRNIKKVMSEILRVSKSIIMGWEYFGTEAVDYRGEGTYLWQRDWMNEWANIGGIKHSEFELFADKEFPMEKTMAYRLYKED